MHGVAVIAEYLHFDAAPLQEISGVALVGFDDVFDFAEPASHGDLFQRGVGNGEFLGDSPA